MVRDILALHWYLTTAPLHLRDQIAPSYTALLCIQGP